MESKGQIHHADNATILASCKIHLLLPLFLEILENIVKTRITVSTVLDKNAADKNFRRTKLPKIGLGAENFVRRKLLSAENFVRRIFVR